MDWGVLRSVTILAVSLAVLGSRLPHPLPVSVCLLAANLVAQRFNVKVANATDTDFWNMMRLLEPIDEIVLLAVPNHHSNVYGAARIRPAALIAT